MACNRVALNFFGNDDTHIFFVLYLYLVILKEKKKRNSCRTRPGKGTRKELSKNRVLLQLNRQYRKRTRYGTVEMDRRTCMCEVFHQEKEDEREREGKRVDTGMNWSRYCDLHVSSLFPLPPLLPLGLCFGFLDFFYVCGPIIYKKMQ